MNRNLEQAFAEQAGQLFTKCRAYIGIDEAMPPEAKEALKEEIAAAWEALDVDLMQLYEEIAANLEEPMSEQQRERYCFKLLTPFKEFSSVLYPYWEIGQDREYLETVQGVSDYEERVKRIEKQIAAAQARADRWFDKCFGANGIKATDEVEAVCFELAQLIKGYGIVLDAAFVVNGIDLKRMQERCGVWIISFPRLCRAWEIGEFIGSEALALEYLNKLHQEQPQGVTNIDTLAGVAPEPQQIEQNKIQKKRGRPTEPFTSKMIDDANGDKLKKMHKVLAGKKGRDFALLIWACIKKGLCNKPTYTQAKEEFGDIGEKTGYNRYLNNNNMFTQEEKEGALKSLE